MNFSLPKGANLVAYVVYGKKTGAVVHIHQSISFPGSKPMNEDALGARAVELAIKLNGVKTSEVEVLRVVPDQIKPGAHYRVDVKKKAMVAVPPKKAARGDSLKRARK
jgi:hypothetical protein